MSSDVSLEEGLVRIVKSNLVVEGIVYAQGVLNHGNLRISGEYLVLAIEGKDHFVALKDLHALLQSPWRRINADDGDGISVASLYIENYDQERAIGGTGYWQGVDVAQELHRLDDEVRSLRITVAALTKGVPG